jgi:undecaprenyl diphosphate synthase
MARLKNLPKYVAIVMDGNGRWAKQRGLKRTAGHEAGAENVRQIVRSASELGIKELTLYAFSTENWSRSRSEVKFLMNLLERQLIEQRDETMEQNVRFSAIGGLQRLPAGVRRELDKTTELSRRNTGLHARLALNYGGRQEILDAVAAFCADNPGRKSITEKQFHRYFYHPSMHDPDLFIRTGGEKRVSNFLLWQISYAELYFTDVLWPDFLKPDLVAAIADYGSRERRFGGL